MNKISCGGFLLGENLIQTVDEKGMPVLNATGGADIKVVKVAIHETDDGYEVITDENYDTIHQYMSDGTPVVLFENEYYSGGVLFHPSGVASGVWGSDIYFTLTYSQFDATSEVWDDDAYYQDGCQIVFSKNSSGEQSIACGIVDLYYLTHFNDTGADDGKMLTIEDGMPVWRQSIKVLNVEIGWATDHYEIITNETFNSIKKHLEKDIPVVLFETTGKSIFTIRTYDNFSLRKYVEFAGLWSNSYNLIVTFKENENEVLVEEEYRGYLPDYTSADNGKVLKLVNNVPTWSN